MRQLDMKRIEEENERLIKALTAERVTEGKRRKLLWAIAIIVIVINLWALATLMMKGLL